MVHLDSRASYLAVCLYDKGTQTDKSGVPKKFFHTVGDLVELNEPRQAAVAVVHPSIDSISLYTQPLERKKPLPRRPEDVADLDCFSIRHLIKIIDPDPRHPAADLERTTVDGNSVALNPERVAGELEEYNNRLSSNPFEQLGMLAA